MFDHLFNLAFDNDLNRHFQSITRLLVGQHLLDLDIVLPEVVEIVLVSELFVRMEAEVRQASQCRIVGKATPT
jgi:hypothetical protein